MIWSQIKSIRENLDKRIVSNATSLYGAQAINYVLPLVMVPYLARVLGPETWGIVIFVQAIGLYVNMLVNYSFDFSASREVARERGSPDKLADLVAGVVGGRLVLALVAIAVIGLAYLFVPALRDVGLLLWLSAFWFIMTGMVPFWFFLGLERVRRLLIVELSLKSIAVGLVIWLVNGPADAWMVFAIQGAAAFTSACIAMYLVFREVPFRAPSVRASIQSLRDGAHLFVLRASSSVFTQSNTIILGFVASAASVGFYGGAERISRIAVQMMYPAVNAMYPRASLLAKDDPQAAARFARSAMILLFSLNMASATFLFLLAPWAVRIVLGPGYDEAVHVLRILLILHPIMGISIPLTMHWMIPMKMESILTKITVAAGVAHIPLAAVLGSMFAHTGVAWAVILTETAVLAVIVGIVMMRGVGPFHKAIFVREAKESAAQ